MYWFRFRKVKTSCSHGPDHSNTEQSQIQAQRWTYFEWVLNLNVWYSVLLTVGIWILTIWIPETFEYLTFWSLDFKWFCIQMINLWVISLTNQLNTRPVHEKTRWHPTSFRPLKYQTSLVFRSSVYLIFGKWDGRISDVDCTDRLNY